MRLVFPNREAGLTEKMDDPACNPAGLEMQYRHFLWVNRLFSGWRRLYSRYIRPVLQEGGEPVTILDAGCGGGDIPRRLADWIERDGYSANITALDPDERAIGFAARQHAHQNILYRCGTMTDLLEEGRTFDIVLSNHVLHHLPNEEVARVLDQSDQLARRLVLHNDIHRSAAAYAIFKIGMTPIFRAAFTVQDGLISIRKSFTATELRAVASSDWSIRRMFPWRVLAIRQVAGDG